MSAAANLQGMLHVPSFYGSTRRRKKRITKDVDKVDFSDLAKKLGPDATAEDYIHDFLESDDPRFEGKSKKERIRMALGAYYGKAADPRIAKVDDKLGLVMGYAIVCEVDGEPYYDLNIDYDGQRVPEHIPESTMLKCAADFMLNSRLGNEMHSGPDKGTYVFAFPLTKDIAKAMGIETRKTGLLVAYKPPPDVLAKFMDGTYRGFSIEGRRLLFDEEGD